MKNLEVKSKTREIKEVAASSLKGKDAQKVTQGCGGDDSSGCGDGGGGGEDREDANNLHRIFSYKFVVM